MTTPRVARVGAFASAAIASAAGAATLHVPADFPTIADAIMASSDGDIIQLAPGAYVGPFSFGTKAVTLRGEPDAPETTIVSPAAFDPSLLLTIPAMPEGDTITLDGLTLGGYAEFAVMDGSLAVRHCVITTDANGLSVAFGISNGALSVSDVTIDDSGYEPHNVPLFHVHAGLASLSRVVTLAGSRPIFRGISSKSSIADSTFGGLTLDPALPPIGAVESIVGELDVASSLFAGIGPGSGIVAQGSSLSVADTEFTAIGQPLEGNDSAIIADGPSITLTECGFSLCGSIAGPASVATLTADAILLDGCTVTDNILSDAGCGGCMLSGTATILRSTFARNSTFGFGGALVVLGNATISDTLFSANLGGDGCGALRLVGDASLLRCDFLDNVAGDGAYGAAIVGGAVVVEGGTVSLTDCLMQGNSAANNGKSEGVGGAIAGLDGATITLIDSAVLENLALTAGGGAYVDASSFLALDGSTICSNLPDQVFGDHSSAGSVVCGCAGDITGDGGIDGADLATILGSWGPCSGVASDLNSDGFVDASDLAIVLGAWGPCQ